MSMEYVSTLITSHCESPGPPRYTQGILTGYFAIQNLHPAVNFHSQNALPLLMSELCQKVLLSESCVWPNRCTFG